MRGFTLDSEACSCESCSVNQQNDEFISIPEVAELLGSTQNKVRRMIEERFFATKRFDNVPLIPAIFVQNGASIPGVRGTIMLLEDLGFSNDEAVDWLLAENEDLGERPIEALRSGHKAPVRRAVQLLL